MISYKELYSICILLLKLQIANSQWYKSCSSSAPIYYVPSSAPPEYTKVVQGYPLENAEQCQPLGVPPTFGQLTPSGVPLEGQELYEGQYQAAAAATAHPNQPVIIINNGDYATKKEKGGLFGGDGGDLLALLFATHAHHAYHAGSGLLHPLLPPPPPPLPPPPPPSYDNSEKNANGPININITIIIQKSDSEGKSEIEDN